MAYCLNIILNVKLRVSLPALIFDPCRSMIDFTVDVFGLANRRSGAYNLVRAAGLGYFWGNSNARDGAASTCQYLQNDVQVGGRLVTLKWDKV